MELPASTVIFFNYRLELWVKLASATRWDSVRRWRGKWGEFSEWLCQEIVWIGEQVSNWQQTWSEVASGSLWIIWMDQHS